MDKKLCTECNHWHTVWLSCYSAAKGRQEIETGKDFWTDKILTEEYIALLREAYETPNTGPEGVVEFE